MFYSRRRTMNTPPQPVVSTDPPSFSTGAQPPYILTLFFGPDGLRPGWGLLAYVALFLVLQPFFENIAYAIIPRRPLWSLLLEKFADFLAALLPALLLAKIERRPWRSYGLCWKQALRRTYWAGAFWGF